MAVDVFFFKDLGVQSRLSGSIVVKLPFLR